MTGFLCALATSRLCVEFLLLGTMVPSYGDPWDEPEVLTRILRSIISFHCPDQRKSVSIEN